MSTHAKHHGKALLSLHDVGINYGNTQFGRKRKDHWVLRHISFDLDRGESLGVIGSNGIGKSTLLRTMAGIIRPDEGKVKLQRGRSASLLTLGVGFMQELSGRENIYLGGLMMGMTMQEIRALFDEIVQFAELEDAIDRPYHTYSSGMRIRLGFSLSLQRKPDILLLDEVLAVGDTAFRKKSADAMMASIRSEQTVVLVSHNGQTIADLCNRAIWIDGGSIRAEGAPAQVVAQYEKHSLATALAKQQAAAGAK